MLVPSIGWSMENLRNPVCIWNFLIIIPLVFYVDWYVYIFLIFCFFCFFLLIDMYFLIFCILGQFEILSLNLLFQNITYQLTSCVSITNRVIIEDLDLYRHVSRLEENNVNSSIIQNTCRVFCLIMQVEL